MKNRMWKRGATKAVSMLLALLLCCAMPFSGASAQEIVPASSAEVEGGAAQNEEPVSVPYAETEHPAGAEAEAAPAGDAEPNSEKDAASEYTSSISDALWLDMYADTDNGILPGEGTRQAEESPLAGSRFTLEKLDGGGAVDPSFPAQTLDTSADGNVTFSSLPAGSCRITETGAPVGYAQLARPFPAEIPFYLTLPASQTPSDPGYRYATTDPLSDDVTYHYYDLTYQVSDQTALVMPVAGAHGNRALYLLADGLLVSSAMLAGGYFGGTVGKDMHPGAGRIPRHTGPRRKPGGGRKRTLANAAVVLLTLVGAVLLVYPYVSFRLATGEQSYVIQQYDKGLAEMEAGVIRAEWDRARRYNASLPGNPLYDPFASSGDGMDAEYQSMLDISGNGVMCRVQIPKIQADLPVFHGVAADTLEKGAGHLEGSSLPVGGAGTHAVLTGHTGLNTAKLFTDLTALKAGDEFYLYTLDQILAYRVDSILIVEPADVTVLLPVAGHDYVTLVTCTPYGVNSHRLLIRGERIGYTQEAIGQRIAETKSVLSGETLLLCAGGVLLIFLVLYLLLFRWHGKRRGKGYRGTGTPGHSDSDNAG